MLLARSDQAAGSEAGPAAVVAHFCAVLRQVEGNKADILAVALVVTRTLEPLLGRPAAAGTHAPTQQCVYISRGDLIL